ncbi:unnamed protein product [Xylocopa violacea]|uniref:CCHC-type domain-containing protein n=1 Tax=Xylocopa violacea TaxID=135666 RepID=A0ABP1N2G9_XYLVO
MVIGIPDEALARTVRSAKYADPNELYASMCAMEKMPGKADPDKQKPKAERTTKPTEKEQPRIRCYNCGKADHVAKNCRRPKLQCADCTIMSRNRRYNKKLTKITNINEDCFESSSEEDQYELGESEDSGEYSESTETGGMEGFSDSEEENFVNMRRKKKRTRIISSSNTEDERTSIPNTSRDVMAEIEIAADGTQWVKLQAGKYDIQGYRRAYWLRKKKYYVGLYEKTYLTSRPVMRLEGIDLEDSRNETDRSNVWSKSVEKTSGSDNGKSDRQISNKSDSNESDVAGPSVKVRSKRKLVEETNKSVTETDNNLESSYHNKINSNEIQETPEPRRSDRIKQLAPISYNENNMFNDCLMTAQYSVYRIPNSFYEIETRNDRVQWQQAITEEINSLLINKTWILVNRPENRNIVDCR